MVLQNPPDNFIPNTSQCVIPEGYIPVVVGHDPVADVFGLEQAIVAGYVPIIKQK